MTGLRHWPQQTRTCCPTACTSAGQTNHKRAATAFIEWFNQLWGHEKNKTRRCERGWLRAGTGDGRVLSRWHLLWHGWSMKPAINMKEKSEAVTPERAHAWVSCPRTRKSTCHWRGWHWCSQRQGGRTGSHHVRPKESTGDSWSHTKLFKPNIHCLRLWIASLLYY